MEEFEQLTQRLAKLQAKNRRETLFKLKELYPDESGEVLFSTTPDANANVVEAESKQTIVIQNTEKKLPRFSGSNPPSHGEVNYRKWQRAAIKLLAEKDLSEDKKKDAVLRSLQGKADDIIDVLRESLSAKGICDVLEAKYGNTIDGEQLLIEFYQMYQPPSKSCSEYLSELFIEIGDVVKYEGIPKDLMNTVLLKQFIRGTSDENMVDKLRLEDQVKNPPEFSNLIVSVRREENKRKERRDRQSKFLGRSRAATVAEGEEQAELPTPLPPPQKPAPTAVRDFEREEMVRMQQRLAELERLAADDIEPPPPDPVHSPEFIQMQQRLANVEQKLKVRNRDIFCYRCGKSDGHMATECFEPPNKQLVDEMMAARRQRRSRKPLN